MMLRWKVNVTALIIESRLSSINLRNKAAALASSQSVFGTDSSKEDLLLNS